MRRPAAPLLTAAAFLLLGLVVPEPTRSFSPPASRGRLARSAQALAREACAGAACGQLPARPRDSREAKAANAEGRQQTDSSGRRAAALGLALGLALSVSASSPARAEGEGAIDGDGGPSIEKGAGVFNANCAACHAGGNNAVQPDKKLKKEALVQYGMYDVERIMYQVTNGKNAMPAFGERLGSRDIADVAAYVMSQAENGWP